MKRLLLVGWDAADWKVIDPLLARGEMPHLASVLQEGVRANLATIEPPLSPMVWTSIATGKRPYKHGIHGFSEPTEDGSSIRLISNLGRKTKAFWNILNQNGKRCIVVGWWPSHPAEPIAGAMVSNRFPLATSDDPAAPMPAGTVWPRGLAEQLSELRVHGVEITPEILQLFVPDASKVDESRDKSLNDLAGIIAETASIHAAATELIEREPWDMAAVYYTGIDHFSHRFMRHHAGKVKSQNGTDPAVFAEVVANAYRYHDVMLGRLIALAGPECAVLVLSDHGFHSDGLLPDYVPPEAAGPAVEHRHFGMFALRAPGIKHGERIVGASVLDIAPTVLRLFGLPSGKDMDGKALLNAFHDPTPLEPIPSWDMVAGDDGCHPSSRQYDGAASAEALNQLVALGYISPPEENAQRTVRNTVRENRYNLARALLGGGELHAAAAILEDLNASDPEDARFYQHLIQCRLALQDRAGAFRVLEAFDAACAEFAPRARGELEGIIAERLDSELTRHDRKETHTRRRLAEKAAGYVSTRLFLRARLIMTGAQTPEEKTAARPILEQIAKAAGRRREPALFLAEGFAALDDDERAMFYIRRARRADRDNWHAMSLEARLHFAAGRWPEAAGSAIESLSLVYFQPYLHCTLGVSLRHLGNLEQAEQSLRVAVSQMPGLVAAHEELAAVLHKTPARIGETGLHLARARVLREQVKSTAKAAPAAKPEAAPALPGFERWTGPPADRSRLIAIVAGLPRSGTSMMMQMLTAAGIPPYTDGLRIADEDNPRGYFEHEQATRLHEDVSWIPATRGKVVKIVANLIPFLPDGEEYCIVFMLRNLDEVLASQQAMLKRLGRKGAALKSREFSRIYTTQLIKVQQWLQAHAAIQVLAIDYGSVLQDPTATAARLAEFLGHPFDQSAAAASVDATLRRQHGSSE